jgi:hypothetical protein
MNIRAGRLRIMVAALVLPGVAVAAAACAAASGTAAAAASGTAAAAAGSTAAAAAGSAPVAVNCAGHGQVRPHQYVLTCADGNNYLAALHWASWGSAGFARGRNTLNDCIPDCVSGHFHSFPVLAVLWRAEPWAGHPGERYFSRITVIYSGQRTYRAGGRVHRLPATSTSPLSPSGGL